MKIYHRLLTILFLLTGLLGRANSASAQEAGTLAISAPDTGAFPTIHLRLDAYNAAGSFLDDLKTGDIQITEDGQILKPQSLIKTKNGLQVTIALNTNPGMATQKDGLSEYQRLMNALLDWAHGQTTSGNDDWSFATPTGLFLIRESDPGLLVKALTEYLPDLPHAQPALGSLAEALDLATDPLGSAPMKRAILYITPPLSASNAEVLVDLTNRAKGIGVRVNVWEIVPAAAAAAKNGNTTAANSKTASNSAANPLQQLAEMTGGLYFTIAPGGEIPEIEAMFAPLRSSYQIDYISPIQKSGSHDVQVHVQQPDGKLESNISRFNVDVQPPNPIFLSPPESIHRTWESQAKTAAGGETASLAPAQVPLHIVIEFPDQHRRALKAARLYANGKLVAENTSEPFNEFNWSISDLTEPSRQVLRVEVVDGIGLSGSSIETPVEILVDQPVRKSIMDRVSSSGLIAVGAVTVAGLVLAAVLFLAGNQRRIRRKHTLADKRLMKDPVTQPVRIAQDHSKPRKVQPGVEKQNPPSRTTPARAVSSWTSAVWSRGSGLTAPARLITLDENEQPITGGAIPLTRQEITFGTDPHRATQVLDSPTVESLHARLYKAEDGCFFLADQGSVAGTWINYAPITASGARLEHGDLIHIGKVMFRFELTESNRVPPGEIKVVDLDKNA